MVSSDYVCGDSLQLPEVSPSPLTTLVNSTLGVSQASPTAGATLGTVDKGLVHPPLLRKSTQSSSLQAA